MADNMTVESIRLAGQIVPDPLGVLCAYVERPKLQRTIRKYDLNEPAISTVISVTEALGTRRIASRVSRREAAWFVRRSTTPEVRAAWAGPALSFPDANLSTADPLIVGDLYDQATTLFQLFVNDRPRGVSSSKIHKVLHPHRRALFPVFDRRLQKLYKASAKRWSQQLRQQRGLDHQGGWAAVREDLIFEPYRIELQRCRSVLAAMAPDPYGLLLQLSDLRLLDILAWSI